MKMPDVTPAQIVALAQAVAGVAVAFGLPLSEAQSVALIGLVGVIATVLFGADAKIRNGRAKVLEAQGYAEAFPAPERGA